MFFTISFLDSELCSCFYPCVFWCIWLLTVFWTLDCFWGFGWLWLDLFAFLDACSWPCQHVNLSSMTQPLEPFEPFFWLYCNILYIACAHIYSQLFDVACINIKCKSVKSVDVGSPADCRFYRDRQRSGAAQFPLSKKVPASRVCIRCY